jgi:hypothetical protein
MPSEAGAFLTYLAFVALVLEKAHDEVTRLLDERTAETVPLPDSDSETD